MSKLHIKKGDTVYVNAGDDKGRTGKVQEPEAERKESSRGYCKAGGSYSYFKLECC